IFMMVAGIPVTYFTLAPSTAVVPGLGLGAVGLALKTVILNVVGVSLMACIIARQQGWKADYRYQAVVLSVLLTLAWISKWFSLEFLTMIGTDNSPVAAMLCGAALFSVLSFLLLANWPEMAGIAEHPTIRAWRQKYWKPLAWKF